MMTRDVTELYAGAIKRNRYVSEVQKTCKFCNCKEEVEIQGKGEVCVCVCGGVQTEGTA